MTLPMIPGYRSPRDEIRWLSIKNKSEETIPGFAVTYLDVDGYSPYPFYSVFEVEGEELIWLVTKPDAVCEALADPALVIVNGPQPIPPGGTGRGTQDWPAQVLHYAPQALPNGWSCGPVADSWYIDGNGGGFTHVSHDRSAPVGEIHSAVHTAWIAPGRGSRERFATLTGGSSAIDAGAALALATATSSQLALFGAAGDYGGPEDDAGNAFELAVGSDLWLSVSATLSSATAAEGSALRLRIETRKYNGSSWSSSILYGYRLHEIDEESPYGTVEFKTAENVSFAGVLQFDRGDQIRLVNDSSVSISAAAVILGAHRIGGNATIDPGISHTS